MSLKIHFLNVGHGDCTFIEFPSGRLMMIDINNSKSFPQDDVDALVQEKSSGLLFRTRAQERSWEEHYKSLLVDPYDYHLANFPGKQVFRYVQTHPDMDHMSGLHRFFWQEKVSLGNFWDTPHKKELDEQSFDSNRYSYLDWQVYQKLRIGAGPTKATDGHKVINAWRNDARSYWEEDGIQILSPTPELVADCEESGDYNNCSYVLKISHAGREIILPGDAEGPVWASILEHYDASDISCDILKAAHHGRQSGYHKDAVETMDPKVVICSVGKKPSTDAAAEYSKVADSVLSTRYYGTITATIRDDGDIWINDRNGEQIAVVDS